MKHQKEWYTCDRCGAEVKPMPMFCRSISRKIGKLQEIKMICDKVTGYCGETQELLNGDYAVTIIENHEPETASYDLCPKCRRDFERFMRNERIKKENCL